MSLGYSRNTDEKSYYKILLGQYRLVDDVCKKEAPTAVAVIEGIIKKTEQNGVINWEDVYGIEKALLLFLNREEMECKLLFLVDMYREIAGDKNLANRMKFKTSALNGISDETLRAELEELVDDLYRHFAVYISCRKSRRKITFNLLLFLIFLFAGAVAWLCTYDGTMPPMFYVIVAGSIGGVISALRRLQEAAATDVNVLTYIDLKYGWLNVLLAPVYGATFSMVLLLFFTSGFLKGDLFPTIATMAEEVSQEADTVSIVMSEFFTNTYPVTGSDCAKLIVWSFIAGFAEKFVPDTLDRLIARSQKSGEKK